MRRNIIAIAASVIMGMVATSAMAQAPVSKLLGSCLKQRLSCS